MQRDQLPQSPQLRLAVAPEIEHIGRGEQAVFLVTLENRSTEAQAQSIDVSGLPPAWYRIDFDARRRVFPGEQRSATLLVTVPADAPAGMLPFQVIARAGQAESQVACSLEVLAPGMQPQALSAAPPQPAAAAAAPAAPPVPPRVSLEPADVTWRGEAQGIERARVVVTNP